MHQPPKNKMIRPGATVTREGRARAADILGPKCKKCDGRGYTAVSDQGVFTCTDCPGSGDVTIANRKSQIANP